NSPSFPCRLLPSRRASWEQRYFPSLDSRPWGSAEGEVSVSSLLWETMSARAHPATPLNQMQGGSRVSLRGKLTDAFGLVEDACPTPTTTFNTSDLPHYLAQEVIRCCLRSLAGLEGVWDEIGYSFEERKGFVDGLLQGVVTVCEERVQAEHSIRDQVAAKLPETKSEILDLSRRMGKPVPETEAASDEQMMNFFFGDALGDGDVRTSSALTDRLAVLELKVDALRLEAKERQERVDGFSAYIVKTCSNMHETIDDRWSDTSGSLTDENIALFEEKAAEVKVMRDAREKLLVGLVQRCQALFRELKFDEPQLPLDNIILLSLDPYSDEPKLREDESSPSCCGLSVFSIDRLNKKIEELEEDLAERREQVQECRAEIHSLWEKLEVPQGEREIFNRGDKVDKDLSRVGYKDVTYYENEVRKLREAKAAQVPKLMHLVRAEIAELLKTGGGIIPPNQAVRTDLLETTESSWSLEVLQEHEDAVKNLKDILGRLAPILKAIEVRDCLLQDLEAVNNAEIDYTNTRGPGFQAQLKELNAKKKRIVKIPQVTEALKKLATEWKDMEGWDLIGKAQGLTLIEELEQEEAQAGGKKQGSSSTTAAGASQHMRKSSGSTRSLRCSGSDALNTKQKSRGSRRLDVEKDINSAGQKDPPPLPPR
ncbi:unnamed protein product, partial [Chrysoparadoxa australica]